MVGIVVVAGGVIGYAVFGIGITSDSAPPRSVEQIENGDGTVSFILQGGESIDPEEVNQLRVSGAGVSSVTSWLGNTSATGQTYTLDEEIRPGDEIVTVAVSGDGPVTIAQEGDTSGIIGGSDSDELPSGNNGGSSGDGSQTNTVTAEPNATEVFSTMEGSGSASDPYQITNVSQLHAMRHATRNNTFVLQNDIDASGTAQWNNGSGWEPLEVDSGFYDPYALDGNNHTISGLTIDRPNTNEVAMFEGTQRWDDTITNLKFENADVTGENYVAIVVAEGAFPLSNIEVSGSVTGVRHVGGIGGIPQRMDNPQSGFTTDVTVTGKQNVGTFIGSGAQIGGEFRDIQASGTVNVIGDESMTRNYGIVAGKTSSAFTNVTATGTIDVDNGVVNDHVGGVVGSYGTAKASSNIQSDVDITGDAKEVGGFAGRTSIDDVEINQVDVSGSIDVTGNRVGGFFGTTGDTVVINDSITTVSLSTDGSVAGGVTGTIQDEPEVTLNRLVIATPITASSDTGVVTAENNNQISNINNIYYDENDMSGIENTNSSSVTSVQTDQLKGEDASTNLPGLDFNIVWEEIASEYPTPVP